MRQIDNVLISDEVWETNFNCDIAKCKGQCCKYGDIGSPITEQEDIRINTQLKEISSYLTQDNLEFLQQGGISLRKDDSLHIREPGHNIPCPLSYEGSNGVLLCSLHSRALKVCKPILDYKPLWCSLYPLIIKQVGDLWLINCHFQPFCVSEEEPKPILLSFKDLLTDIFGFSWTKKLEQEYKKFLHK